MTELEQLLAERPHFHEVSRGQLANWQVGDEVLRYLYEHVDANHATLETGAGLSTVVFALRGAAHTCVTPAARETERIRAYCAEHGISCDRVSFVIGPSEDMLPSLAREPLDFALIDGSHSLPATFLDWQQVARRLRPLGIVVVDNTGLWTGKVLAEFLDADPDWSRVATFPVAAAFRLGTAHRDKGWWEQPYVARRSSAAVFAAHPDLIELPALRRVGACLRLLSQGRLRDAMRLAARFGKGRTGFGVLARGAAVFRDRGRMGRTTLTAPDDGSRLPLDVRRKNEGYDAQLQRLIELTQDRCATCIDVGAHSGAILEGMVRACPSGRHFAFEPIPELAAALHSRFTSVKVHEVALADSPGRASFQWVVNDPHYSGLRRRSYPRDDAVIETIEVEVARLDDIIPASVTVGLIKVDVEGGEYGVMKGAVETIRRCRPFVVFEASSESTTHYGVQAQEMFRFLVDDCGLLVSTMSRWLNRERPLVDDEFVARFESGEDFYFLAYPEERQRVAYPEHGSKPSRLARLRVWKQRVVADRSSLASRLVYQADRARLRFRQDGLVATLRRAIRIDPWSRVLLNRYGANYAIPECRGGGALVIDWSVPSEDRNAGALRLTHIVRLLRSLGVEVTVLAHDMVPRGRATANLERLGVRVISGPFPPGAFVDSEARFFDFCWVNYADLAEIYVPLLNRAAPAVPIVFDTVDLHFLRAVRRTVYDAGESSAARYRAIELDLVRRSAATIVVTEREKEILQREVPGSAVHVVPTIHVPRAGVEPGPGFDDRKGLLFVGNFVHAANGDAVLFFVREILPRVRDAIGMVPLSIVGPEPDPEIRSLATEIADVEVFGWVQDLELHYARARIAIAPLRWGAGMKGKIGEAMARGLPVVTTPIGAEGMDLEDGAQVLIAATAEEFAAKLVECYRDASLWRRLSDASVRHVEDRWSPDIARQRLAGILSAHGLFPGGGELVTGNPPDDRLVLDALP